MMAGPVPAVLTRTTRTTQKPVPERQVTGELGELLGSAATASASVFLSWARRYVEIPIYVRHEKAWTGDLPGDFAAVPNKPALVLDGIALYPELLVVRLLERGGWQAAWRKNWGGTAYWRGIREPIEPSPLATSIVDQISAQAGHACPWEVVAWRGREVRFVSSHVGDGQRISAYQAAWLDAALRMGVPLGCFAVVEHRLDRQRAPRRR
jgi:hypothetical protein